MDVPIKIEIGAIDYCANIDVKHLLAIMDYEFKNDVTRLHEVLEKETNAVKVDYGQFVKTAIFYTLEHDDDCPQEHMKIVKCITDYINSIPRKYFND